MWILYQILVGISRPVTMPASCPGGRQGGRQPYPASVPAAISRTVQCRLTRRGAGNPHQRLSAAYRRGCHGRTQRRCRTVAPWATGYWVGMGAILLDGVIVGRRVMIGAGSLVPPGKQARAGFLYMGPVKRARPLQAGRDRLPEDLGRHHALPPTNTCRGPITQPQTGSRHDAANAVQISNFFDHCS